MSLVEPLMAMVVLLISVMGFSQAILGSMVTSDTNHEAAIATQATRQLLETMRAEDFRDLFARYNADPGDDPAGGVASPGSGIPLPELALQEGDPDGFAISIEFPTSVVDGDLILNEQVASQILGAPLDMNADGVIDGNDRSLDYLLLPVLVRVEWRGPSGPARMELKTILADL